MSEGRYELIVAPSARRQLSEELPKAVAFAAFEFIVGPLLDNPHRVSKRLRPPLEDRHSARRGTYRVLYRIDEDRQRVTVVGVFSRADAYRGQPPDNGQRKAVQTRTSSGDIWVIVSSGCFIDLGEEVVEEFGSSGLAVFGGVVSLSEEDGLEGFVGGEVGAFLADGLEAAVELDGSGA